MGLYDRDYMKERPDEKSRLGNLLSGGRWWMLLGVAVFLLVVVAGIDDGSGVVFPVDANTATRQQLSQIPRLRQDVIEGIIKARPFASFDDIDRVYGVGPKTFELLKTYLFVTSTNASASPRSR